ncbi:MAG: hypothetical protein GX804_09235, partial [Lentisphaerae bacterium]|nr:hypothetical protein [Lentisphaerota bacterium]
MNNKTMADIQSDSSTGDCRDETAFPDFSAGIKSSYITDTSVVFDIREYIGADYPRTLCFFDIERHGLLSKKISKAIINGQEVPFQVSERNGIVGVFIKLPKYGHVRIEFTLKDENPGSIMRKDQRWSRTEKGVLLNTSTGAVRLPDFGITKFDMPIESLNVPAPVQYLIGQSGERLGRGYIDTYERMVSMGCSLLEDGPLWTTIKVCYKFDNNSKFEFECTAADGEEFLRIRERSDCGPKARWVMMFDKKSGFLPDSISLADHTLFYQKHRMDYFSDRLHARLYPWTQGTQIAALREGVLIHSNGSPDCVGWFVRTEREWDGFKNTFVEFYERRFDTENLRTRGGETIGDTYSWLPPDVKVNNTSDVSAFCAEAMLLEGNREYGIIIGRRSDWCTPDPVPEHTLEWYEGPALTDEWEAVRSPLRRIIQFQGLCSVDMVKDWILHEKIPEKDGLDSSHPAMENAYNTTITSLLFDKRRNAIAIVREMYNTLHVLSTGYVMGRGPGGTNPVTLRAVFPLAILFREMMLLDCIPEYFPEESSELPSLKERLVAMLLFLGYLTGRRSFYPGEFTMAPMSDPRSSEPTCLGMPNQNFFTDVFCTSGGIALIFDKHEASQSWLKRANEMLSLQLDVFSDPESGVWEESHTYFHHVLRTLAPFALEQRGRVSTFPHIVDWFKDERFAKLSKAVFHFVTPRDPNAGDKRMMATLGDHRMELNWHTYNALAIGFAEVDETLASNLAWMSVENGWEGKPAVPQQAPELKSHLVSGLGAVFRLCHKDRGESMVVLRAGNTWGHYNCDELEVLYYSGGEPVIVEAGYGNPKTFSKVGPEGHSIMHPVDFVPAFYLSRANRGLIEEFVPDGEGGMQIMSAGRPVAFMHPQAG